MSYPATAVVAGNGIGTATLSAATVGGFGLDFGLSFGGPTVMGPVTAVLAAQPQGIATLATNGVGTAVATEVLVSALLQLV